MSSVSRYRKTQYKEQSKTKTDKNVAESFHGLVKYDVAIARQEGQQGKKRPYCS
ncbi:hypothetical protein [Rippkaea orientalis]|uniref:hypothetical protein n=1 Tax=Rippkaea orientalis TaxID=2546366 RepID=UPI001F4C3CE7|nr:hypothetical protein [Rippkaea orientalis]